MRNHPDLERRLTAVLGPTNTGKTYLAIDRMLGHDSGMIGFPLRLLARENYDRVRKLRGPGAVALITGEERILPPAPRYFMCTVEAMPLDREVAFLAIDEVQLCADPERGHVFTDRLLHARGTEETMFLGAETIARLIKRLVPGVRFESRPRFSKLSYAGHKKVTRLPPRSAVIAFSAPNVYALAELIRRQRGGAAVVLGALSPRTRNAQVDLYENGDVDYIVATDAIGMGLNMSINHVAFSGTAKFDGHRPRRLAAAEIGQIAGRAGRHTADGTFGTTAEQPPFDADLVGALEAHDFEPLRQLFWRNRDLDFSDPHALKRSLDAAPRRRELARARVADDHAALAGLIESADICALATSPEAVKLLWSACQIPNFRGEMSDGHQRLAARIFKFLRTGDGIIPTDWTARAIDRLDRTDGDIDTLIGRIAHIRTWTYISHRGDWLNDAVHWQERARRIEDALSDALHERLAQKFVDARATTLLRQLDQGIDLLAAVTPSGDVIVEGTIVGRLDGFRFAETGTLAGVSRRAGSGAEGQILAAAKRALRFEITRRVEALESAPATALKLRDDGVITWRGDAVARLTKGADALHPHTQPLPSELLVPDLRQRAARALDRWLRDELQQRLAPLFRLETDALTGPARGLAWQLMQGLGSVAVVDAKAQLDGLTADDRKAFAALGVQFGRRTVYLGRSMARRTLTLRRILWEAYTGDDFSAVFSSAVATSSAVSATWDSSPGVGGTVIECAAGMRPLDCLALGYTPAGRWAVRSTDLEHVLSAARQRQQRGRPVIKAEEAAALMAVPVAVLSDILTACGVPNRVTRGGLRLLPHAQRRRRKSRTVPAKEKEIAACTAGGRKATSAPRQPDIPGGGANDGPFAKLRQLQTTSQDR